MIGNKTHPYRFARKAIAFSVVASLFFSSAAPVLAGTGTTPGNGDWNQVKGQLASDVVQGGITFAASLTGNVPLALIAGIVGKYITTYGIKGVRALVDAIKGYPPQDLGEVNIAYVYLINVKRNLYSTLINIRKAAETDSRDPNLGAELDLLEKDVTSLCASGNCKPVTIDDKLVNYSYLQVAMDAKASLNVNEWLSVNESKNTYQYLLLLYLDLIMTEQQLVQSEAFVIGQQVKDAVDALKNDVYISDAEKEYRAGLVLNIGLRWQRMLDQRRVMLASVLVKPLSDIEAENQAIENEINKEQKKKPAPAPIDDGGDDGSATGSIWGVN
jgi:hypothetical protein